jgi:hypothetical protein
VTQVYITVDHFGRKPADSRPLCQGCTPATVDGRSELSFVPARAEYQIVGASGTIVFCRDCAIHAVKSLAARFVLFDPRATRDLMDFFAAEATKKRPATRRKKTAVKRVINVAPPVLLERKKKVP